MAREGVMRMAGEAAPNRGGANVMLADDPCFSGDRLSRILAAHGFDAMARSPAEDLRAWVASWAEPADLVVVSFVAEQTPGLEILRELRASPRARSVPILAVTPFREIGFDLQTLRAHGVVGLVDTRARAEDVLHRLEHTVRPGGRRRMFERVGCFFPVDVEREGLLYPEFALDLSGGGMRLTSVDRLEKNTDLILRFALPMVAGEVVETRARIVHVSKQKNSCVRHELGVFFYPLAPHLRDIIDLEVARLLSD